MKFLLLLIVMGLSGCSKANFDEFVKPQPFFLHHPSSGLCFALINRGTIYSATYVPCTDKVLALSEEW